MKQAGNSRILRKAFARSHVNIEVAQRLVLFRSEPGFSFHQRSDPVDRQHAENLPQVTKRGRGPQPPKGPAQPDRL